MTDDGVKTKFVEGTETAINIPGLLGFASVALRDGAVYRTRPEHGLGLCRHVPGEDQPEMLCETPSISPPVVTRDHVVYGGLDGKAARRAARR